MQPVNFGPTRGKHQTTLGGLLPQNRRAKAEHQPHYSQTVPTGKPAEALCALATRARLAFLLHAAVFIVGVRLQLHPLSAALRQRGAVSVPSCHAAHAATSGHANPGQPAGQHPPGELQAQPPPVSHTHTCALRPKFIPQPASDAVGRSHQEKLSS